MSRVKLNSIAHGSMAILASLSIAHAAEPASMPPLPPSLPAVDGLNGKISGFGGWSDPGARNPAGVPSIGRNPGIFGGAASVTVPLGHRFGFQLDGMGASVRNAAMLGLGGHAFWRDPSKGLIGAYGSFMHASIGSGYSSHRVALEGEAYFGRFTLAGIAGVEGSHARLANGGPTRNNQSFFNDIKLSYYPTDNWRVSAGHTYSFKRHAATFGTEYLVGSRGGTALALFAEGQVGTNNHRGVMAGATLYFGQKDKTLIRRHREDDPFSWFMTHLSLYQSNPAWYREIFPQSPILNFCTNPCGCF